MTETTKIDFVALAALPSQLPDQPLPDEVSGKTGRERTLVIFMGKDFAFGAATLRLIGDQGEALIKKAASAVKFKGKTLSALDLVAPAGLATERLFVIGTGGDGRGDEHEAGKTGGTVSPKPEELEDFAKLGGFAMGKLGHAARAIVAFDPPQPPKDPARAAADFALGMRLRDYSFDNYKTKKKDSDAKGRTEITIAVEKPAAVRLHVKAAEAVTAGVLTARSLVNEPPNVLYPEEFANRAMALKKHGVEVTVLDDAAMRELGMGALLGVGQGSARASRAVIMRWRGGKAPKEGVKESAKSKSKPVAFVGKGVCFDTGGISIKPAAGMEDMKGDMAGAACVVGLMQALAERKANVDASGQATL